jgi:hypothetical protein
MDDRHDEEAGKASKVRFVNDRDMMRVLDDCLWQVERRRAPPPAPIVRGKK